MNVYTKFSGLCAFGINLASCAGSLPEPNGAEFQTTRCAQLDTRHQLWGGTAKFEAALAGGSGLGSLTTDDKTARLSMAIGTAVLAAGAAGAEYVSEGAAQSFVRECTDPK